MRRLVLLSLILSGCTAEDVPLGTTTTDTGVDVLDAARPDTAMDEAPDTSADTFGAAIDAAGAVSASIKEEYLFQSCLLGGTKPDPVHVKATISLENTGSKSLGVVTASKAKFVSGGLDVATFTFPEVSLDLAAMTTATATFEKTPDSVDPKASCGTLTCGGTVNIEITLSGPGATVVARSAEITVECAM